MHNVVELQNDSDLFTSSATRGFGGVGKGQKMSFLSPPLQRVVESISVPVYIGSLKSLGSEEWCTVLFIFLAFQHFFALLCFAWHFFPRYSFQWMVLFHTFYNGFFLRGRFSFLVNSSVAYHIFLEQTLWNIHTLCCNLLFREQLGWQVTQAIVVLLFVMNWTCLFFLFYSHFCSFQLLLYAKCTALYLKFK